MRRLSLLLAVLVAFAFAPAASSAQVQASDYYFETDDGEVVFSNVRLAFLDAGNGDYVALLTITPTQDEIDTLLLDGWSHVDFEFSFRGIEQSGDRNDFANGVSDYVRQAGAVVTNYDDHTVYQALGLNIELRWVAGESFTVLAPIFGYQTNGDGSPRVSVKVVSTKWWFEDGSCAVVYERTTNNETLRYCTAQDEDSRATLFDWEGDKSFRAR